jgi:hypothetical protein
MNMLSDKIADIAEFVRKKLRPKRVIRPRPSEIRTGYVSSCARENLNNFWGFFLQDVRFGWRMTFARPGFAAVAVLSIALGIGATTTIFSVIYAVLIDPYPYRAADRIGWIGAQTGINHVGQPLFSPAQYLEIKSRVQSMEDVVTVQQRQPILTGGGLLPGSKPGTGVAVLSRDMGDS